LTVFLQLKIRPPVISSAVKQWSDVTPRTSFVPAIQTLRQLVYSCEMKALMK